MAKANVSRGQKKKKKHLLIRTWRKMGSSLLKQITTMQYMTHFRTRMHHKNLPWNRIAKTHIHSKSVVCSVLKLAFACFCQHESLHPPTAIAKQLQAWKTKVPPFLTTYAFYVVNIKSWYTSNRGNRWENNLVLGIRLHFAPLFHIFLLLENWFWI